MRLIGLPMAGALLLWASYGTGGTAEVLPAEIREWGLRTIDLVYREEYDAALDVAKRIVRKYSDHPAGYFFSAVVIDAWMAYYHTDAKEEELYHYCDAAVSKGEAMLARKDNPWIGFFVGGAEGLKGSYEQRYERWITAFRYGWRGVSILKGVQLTHPEIIDIEYGTGTYEYWRSAMSKAMFWLPGVEDRREAGIAKLYTAKDSGLFTRTPAAANLMTILNNEHRYDELLELSSDQLASYPNCQVFRWGKIWALFGLGRYGLIEKELKLILDRAEADQAAVYSAILCRLWLAKTAFAQKKLHECVYQIERLNSYKHTSDLRQRLDRQFSEGASLRELAIERMHSRNVEGKQPDSGMKVSGSRISH